MTIIVKFFAAFRELVGKDVLTLHVAERSTVTDIIAQLEQQYPEFKNQLETLALAAVNDIYVHRQQELQPGDVMALFPPVSGG